ncbi:MAG TPA: IS21 family transposase [Candidatus Sulfotelmatobacter sp.]|nr:IS21 family transposase [Candidatus Sulfotelmatobacter sp.]
MAAERLSMRTTREILRLKWSAGRSNRQIAQSCGIARSTVAECLHRATEAGLAWPLPPELDDGTLEARLYPPPDRTATARPQPDWAELHRELRRPGVTLQLLWQEYKAAHPAGYQYSQFCVHYRDWAATLDVVLRQEHRAGEKCFVDYAGQPAYLTDPTTGAKTPVPLFVAVLGASNYTYAEASLAADLPAWIAAHIHAFEYFHGVPACVVPDNHKGAVLKPDRYEPDLNPTYADLASHYGTAILPTRVKRPRDKAKAETAVLLAERWILAALRNRTFFTLAELNAAIWELLERLNARRFRKLPTCRQVLFATVDKPALRPLPATRYVFAEWKRAGVNIDYHVEVDRHYYSVPYQLVRQPVEVRLTATTVEILYQGQRVASHLRSYAAGKFTTEPAHRPKAHQAYLEWTPSRLIRWAEQTGPSTAALVAAILASRPHPEQGYRSCLGLLRLGKQYPTARLEAACARALAFHATSYKSVQSILRTGLDSQPLEGPRAARSVSHSHVRGASYYTEEEQAC